MPTLTIKQPNGRYALFTTVSDDFIAWDCTRNDLVHVILRGEKAQIIENVKRACDRLDKNEPRTSPFSMTLEEALRTFKRVHGKDHVLAKRKRP